MKRIEFETLKTGDIVVLKRGRDEGKKAEVVYIEDDSILLRSMPGEIFKAISRHNAKLKLTHWREIDFAE